MAIKASYAVVNGVSIATSKDPKTDSGKKSLKGLLKVEQIDGEYITTSDTSEEQEKQGLLTIVFSNGSLTNTTSFEDIQIKANDS